MAEPQSPKQVALFATCLLDLFRPSVGFATAKLIEEAGYEVVVPPAQTCCGQPNYNGGDREGARKAARHTLKVFAPYPYVVVPSGSCASTIVKHYPTLFDAGTADRAAAEALSRRTFELTAFLHDIAGVREVKARYHGRVTYHDSCSGLRDLGIKRQPRALLASVEGLELKEMMDPELCCGFGGTFCIKYPDISDKMVTDKTGDIALSEARAVVAGDIGCLMNIEGKLHRDGKPQKALHVAEVLAGMSEEDGIS